MSKLRVYKVAEQLGMDNKALVALFQSLGVDEVRNHMSTVSSEQVERAKRHLSRGDDEKVVEERVRGGGGAGVIIRRKKASDASDEPAPEPAPPVRRPARGATESAVAAPRPPAPTPAAAVKAGVPANAGASVKAAGPVRVAGSVNPAGPVSTAGSVTAGSVSTAVASPSVGQSAPSPSDEVSSTQATKPAAAQPREASGATAEDRSSERGPVAAEAARPAPVVEQATPRTEAVEATTSARPQAAPSSTGEAARDGAVSGREVESTSAGSVSPAAEAASERTPLAERGVSEARPVSEVTAQDERGAADTRGALRESSSERVVVGSADASSERSASKQTSTVAKSTTAATSAGERTDAVGGGTAKDPAVMTDRARSKEPAVKSENGAAAPIAAKLETAAVPAPPKVAAQEPKNQAVEPIRRVSAPLGPAAAAAARAAERAREVSAPGERSSGQAASATRSVSDVRGLQRAKPAASDPARPAPKTGIDVWEGRPGVPMPQAPRSSGVPRRVQYDAKGGGSIGSQAPRRGPQQSNSPQGNNSRGRGGSSSGARRGGVNQFSSRRPGTSSIVTQERAAHKKVVRIEGDVSLQNLAAKMGVKAGEVLMKLMSLGMSGININSTLDSDTAKLVSEEFGWTVEDVAVSEDAAIAAAQGGDAEDVDEEREPRPPVVTVMGHVDHGKTSLLDKIRKSTVAQGEAGGITQHIGAYSVKTRKGRVTFLDTPGHAAFTQMRARGAKVTDVVVLVVAADDGVMPQTREAVSHAKDAKCPIVVAVNKIDKPDAQPERVRRELSELGLVPEEWGGDTLFCEVSAHSGQGIDELLDAILLQAEVLDLRANPKRHARGTVIEAKLDRGQGPVATVLVMEGTLRKGDGVLVGNSWGKVRAMLDEHGRNVPSAGPSTPVAVIGLSEVPSAGDIVDAVSDAKKAQQIAEQRRDKLAEKSRGASSKVSLEELARRMSQSDQKELKLIIKGDVQGSVEALSDALSKLTTEKVRVTVVHSGVGAVTEGDVNLAVAAKAIIISFNARPAGKAAALAQKEEIEIRQYSVIYDAIDDVLATMQGLLAPKLVEEAIGEAEVRKIFKVSKAGVVAGCMVTNGVVRRNSFVRLRRGKDIIWEGKLESLRRFKDDAKEVREGFDCGISFAGFSDVQEGDIVNAFEMKEVRATL